MRPSVRGLSADHCAVGIIRACKLFGTDPLRTFETGRRGVLAPRQCVAAALISVFPRTSPRDGLMSAMARVFSVAPTKLSPSSLSAHDINSGDMLDVIEAMHDAGFDPAKLSLAGAVAPVASPPSEAVVTIPVHGHIGSFDPAVLGERKSRPPVAGAVCRSEAAARRQADLDRHPSEALGMMFFRDDQLVTACLAQGGFPQVVSLKTSGKTKVFLVDQNYENWEHRA